MVPFLAFTSLSLIPTCQDLRSAFQLSTCCHESEEHLASRYALLDMDAACTVEFGEGTRFPPLLDTLDLIVVGTESPAGRTATAQSCYVIRGGDEVVLVDAGSGCNARLGALGLASSITRVLLTHFHSDHIADLGNVRLNFALQKNETLPVHGPAGTAGVVDGMVQMLDADAAARIAHHKTLQDSSLSFTVNVSEFDVPPSGTSTVVFESGAFRVTAFRTFHPPVRPNVGYRFDYGTRSITFSGDTVYDPSFINTIRGSDVLIQDVMDEDLLMALVNVVGASTRGGSLIADVADYHANVSQVAWIAHEAGVAQMQLTHLTPLFSGLRNRSAVQENVMRRLAHEHAGVAERTTFATPGQITRLPLDSDSLLMSAGVSRPWIEECAERPSDLLDLLLQRGSASLFDPPRSGTAYGGNDGWTPPLFPDGGEAPADGPDLRGVWRFLGRISEDGVLDRNVSFSLQRIEQGPSNRISISGPNYVHDMVANGVLSGAVRDYVESAWVVPSVVMARYAKLSAQVDSRQPMAHQLKPVSPVDLPYVVHRYLADFQGRTLLHWNYFDRESFALVLAGLPFPTVTYVGEKVAEPNVGIDQLVRLAN